MFPHCMASACQGQVGQAQPFGELRLQLRMQWVRTDAFLEQKAQRGAGVCVIWMRQAHRALLWTAEAGPWGGARSWGAWGNAAVPRSPGRLHGARPCLCLRFAVSLPHTVHSVLPPLTGQAALGLSSEGCHGHL